MSDGVMEEPDLLAPEMAAPQPPAGWYPDPSRNGRRYWDGAAWTTHAQALLLAVRVAEPEVAPRKPKSAWLAFVLGLIFGPFGMLYTTLAGFAAMLTLGVLGSLLFVAITFPQGFSQDVFTLAHSVPPGAYVIAGAYLLSCAFWSCVATPAPTAPPPPYDPAVG